MPLAVDAGQNLGALRDEVERLTKHSEVMKTDLEFKEARRKAAEGIDAVAKTRELWNNKLITATRNLELARQEDFERIARYEKKLAEDESRIRALEQAIAAFKAAKPESLPTFLERLRLSKHLPALEEEELDVGLLRSMGTGEELRRNMAELGLSESEAQLMAADLFAVDVS